MDGSKTAEVDVLWGAKSASSGAKPQFFKYMTYTEISTKSCLLVLSVTKL